VKLANWVADRLAAHGIDHVFMLTGGGAMHLNHALGTHPRLATTFTHHEQALAMAAEAYYRLTNRLAVVNVTSGPGGTNAITGVYGAYVDSIGMLVLSGQVKTETTVRATGLPLRQFGDQELDIEPIVRPITKYAMMVTDPLSIRYHLEKALYLATSGRPGPVWLDIPLDVQAAKIDPAELAGFDPAELDEPWKATDLDAAATAILEKLAAAERPVVFAGSGVRLSGAHADFLRLIEKLGVPVVSGWNAHDVLWNAHPLYAGRPGTVGDRGGNMVTQSADLLLVLGSRLNIRQVSYNWKTFAREAYKIWVDIDPVELRKPTVSPDMPVVADLADMIPALLAAPYEGPTADHREWLEWSRERVRRFPHASRISRSRPRRASLCRDGSAVRSARRGRRRRHRQWQRLRGQLPGRRDQARPAAVDQFRLRDDGLRSARRDRRLRRDRRQAARHRHRRRRQHHDEPAGDADHRRLRHAGEGFPHKQQRLRLDLPDASQLLQRCRGRRRPEEQRHLPRFRQGRGGFRLRLFPGGLAQPASRRDRSRAGCRRPGAL
jgi:TPP-dependent trihydroxycyclohexane-1,2-dione (THcHDO) dehydratase